MPSTATSCSLHVTVATGADDVSVSSTRGLPAISRPSGSSSHVSESASSWRWSVGWPQGRCPAQEIQAAVPTSGFTAYAGRPTSGYSTHELRSLGQVSARHSPGTWSNRRTSPGTGLWIRW